MKQAKIIKLPIFPDKRGNLCFAEGCTHIPFEIKNFYLKYNIFNSIYYKGCAFPNTELFFIALYGSLNIITFDGIKEIRFNLNYAQFGLHIPNLVWIKIENFKPGSILLIISSTENSDIECISNIEVFQKLIVK